MARLRGPIQTDMQAMQTTDLWRFTGALLFDEKATKQFCQGARLNTDENPLLEFSTPRHLNDTQSWFTALQVAYEAGKGSRLSIETNQLQSMLRSLGVKAPTMQVTQTFIQSWHPDELAAREFGTSVSDIGVLSWEIVHTQGSISFQAFPANAETYPPALLRWWEDAANTRSSRARRELSNAALLAESDNQKSQSVQEILKKFKGKEGDGKLVETQNTPSLNQYFKAS